MRKSLFVVLAIMALAVSASAQSIRWGYIPQTPDGWYYKIQGDQVGMLTADNLGMVSGLTDQLRRSDFRSLRDDLRWGGDAYGIPVGQGFYPMYDRNRHPMSAKKAAVIYGAIGAVGGGLVGRFVGPGTRRNQITSTLVGAGFGALVGALTHRGGDRREVIVTPPTAEPQPQSQQVYWNHGAPVAVGYRPNLSTSGGYQPVSSPVQQGGDWKTKNRTGFKVELWDGERFVILLQPNQLISLANPQEIRGVMLIPGSSGKIVQRDAVIKASRDFDGWDLLAPSVP